MAQIYDSIKGLITPKRVSAAALALGEKETNVSDAASVILPSLLGALLKGGANDRISAVVTDSGKEKLTQHLDDIYTGSGIINGKNLGERMENALIGSQNQQFPVEVAAKSGIAS